MINQQEMPVVSEVMEDGELKLQIEFPIRVTLGFGAALELLQACQRYLEDAAGRTTTPEDV